MIDTLYQSEQFKHGKTRDWDFSASMSGIFLNYVSNVPVWTFTESILAQCLGLCSSLPCWWHKTLYQTQSQRHYWNVDWLIALYLHHFWCFYSCVPPVFFFVGFFYSPCFILFVCVYFLGECDRESEWVGEREHICNYFSM